MAARSCTWKPNWPETRQHFEDWWNHTGLVLGGWGAPPLPVPWDPTPLPPFRLDPALDRSAS